MRIVLGYHTLASFAGSESYLVTIAEQLQRLGHDVRLFTHERGPIADTAAAAGLRVEDEPGALPRACDGVLAQDGRTAYELAERYPAAAHAYVVHSADFLSQLPPQLAGAGGALVVMNERIGRFARGLAGAPEIVRLRQPIDLVRFSRWSHERPVARRVLALGHDHRRDRWGEIERVCDELGLRAELVGQDGRTSATPERDIAAADIVIGIGRCVLEAMACGKAAYVNGVIGGDGWVTPEAYAALEADGFSGRAFEEPLDAARMRADLAAWTPELGRRGKELAWLHHDASAHAGELVALLRRLGAAEQAPAPRAELARLVRVQTQAERRALALAHGLGEERLRADALERRLEELTSTRRWRLACALSRPLDRLRALARRPRELARRPRALAGRARALAGRLRDLAGRLRRS